MTLKLIIASLAVLGFATVAQAQDVIIEDDATVAEQAPADETVMSDGDLGPRVYGWTMRPADCGTFRYWNGARCADARDEPPVPN